MIRQIRRVAPVAAALLAAVPCAAQKQPGSNGGVSPLAMTTHTDKPLRAVYRAAIDAVLRNGYALRAMSLDQMLLTAVPEPSAQPATIVRILFETKGDSVTAEVAPIALNPARNQRCTSQQCLAMELAAGEMVLEAIESRVKEYHAPPRTAADSLAAAKAFGYAPENPVKVGGGMQSGVQNEHAWLDALRGPNGETVTWFRLGSCCVFETPNAPAEMEGHGLLDAYEVTYPGLSHPAVLYLDLYDSADGQVVPAGFTRLAAAAPST